MNHGRHECKHGLLYMQCRCIHGQSQPPTIVSCDKISNHDQKLEEQEIEAEFGQHESAEQRELAYLRIEAAQLREQRDLLLIETVEQQQEIRRHHADFERWETTL